MSRRDTNNSPIYDVIGAACLVFVMVAAYWAGGLVGL